MNKDKIAAIIVNAEELEETGWSNIIEYKNKVLHYKKKYRDLMVSNGRSVVSGSSTRRDRQLAHAPRETSEDDVAQIEEEITKKEPKKVYWLEDPIEINQTVKQNYKSFRTIRRRKHCSDVSTSTRILCHMVPT